MIRNYDRTMVNRDYRTYFEDSGFYNFGLWGRETRSQREACEALLARLCALAPASPRRVLDVACGPGGTTRCLTERYPDGEVVGINVSERQLAAARERAPRATFERMNATRLEFPDAHFDAVFCVEAAFHFDTRDRFLAEAFRVTRPGGALVLTDMLFRGFYRPLAEYGQIPRANLLRTPTALRDRIESAGYADVRVEDVTTASLSGFRKHVVAWPARERRSGRMGFGKSVCAAVIARFMAAYLGAVSKAYLIGSARKPTP